MKISVSNIQQPAIDEELVTVDFKGIPAGRGQAVAKFFTDLANDLADGKLDILEAVQLGTDLKGILKP